ncbi:MAG: hypothetical protein J5646_08105 [Bacteroidales bacterium]|nr:hypothetical protein [Bacteroidales bacterium]
MNLSFDINTQEGDKVIVSLVSSYPYLRDIAPAGIPDFELLEVSIIRDKGTSPIKMEIFGKIADILISIAEDNPEGILFYFCDIVEGIPNQRPNKLIASHEYRNELFKLLFKRYSPKARDHWSDIEVVLESDSPKLEMYSHFLLRDKHLPLVDFLRNEIHNNFEIISDQK